MPAKKRTTTVTLVTAPSHVDRRQLRIYWTYDSRQTSVVSCRCEDQEAVAKAVHEWRERSVSLYALSQWSLSIILGELSRGLTATNAPRVVVSVCGPRAYQTYLGNEAGPSHCLSALQVLRDTQLAPSLGGFRRLSSGDIQSLNVAIALLSPTTRHLQKYLVQHLAWPALSQASGADYEAAELITRIIDPRNHVNPLQPDRTAPLRRMLMASVETINTLYRERHKQASRKVSEIFHPAAAATLSSVGHAFAGDHWLADPLDIVDRLEEMPPLLQSRLLDLKKSPDMRKIDIPRWWLGGSQLFLRFVRDYWLDANQETNNGSYVRRLCDLDHYFRTPEVRASWDAHVGT